MKHPYMKYAGDPGLSDPHERIIVYANLIAGRTERPPDDQIELWARCISRLLQYIESRSVNS